jgi:hypothetical protein
VAIILVSIAATAITAGAAAPLTAMAISGAIGFASTFSVAMINGGTAGQAAKLGAISFGASALSSGIAGTSANALVKGAAIGAVAGGSGFGSAMAMGASPSQAAKAGMASVGMSVATQAIVAAAVSWSGQASAPPKPETYSTSADTDLPPLVFAGYRAPIEHEVSELDTALAVVPGAFKAFTTQAGEQVTMGYLSWEHAPGIVKVLVNWVRGPGGFSGLPTNAGLKAMLGQKTEFLGEFAKQGYSKMILEFTKAKTGTAREIVIDLEKYR